VARREKSRQAQDNEREAETREGRFVFHSAWFESVRSGANPDARNARSTA
jgi:hypothetical protein